MHELAQHQGFLDDGERTPMVAGEKREQGLGQIAAPGFDTGGVTPEPSQRGDAPIAIEQYQGRAAVLVHGDARADLAAAFDGTRELLDRTRLQQPRLCETQVQAVQIDFPLGGDGGGGLHNRNLTRRRSKYL